MFYIAENRAIEAFQAIRGNLENKFFGLLGILKCIDTLVVDTNRTYKIVDGELSRFLDNVFYMDEYTGNYGSSEMYVKFSKMWIDYVHEKFLGKYSVNLYDVIAFIYKSKCYNQPPTLNQLKLEFCREFHITVDVLNLWFDCSPKEIQYDERTYLFDGIKKTLSLSGASMSMDKPFFVAARAGELSRAPFLQTLYAGRDSIKCLLMLKENIDDYYPQNNLKTSKKLEMTNIKNLQQIFFGAPGTGKSYEINELTNGGSVIRTTFHPDSDYSTFVGAYKPVMEETPVYGAQGVEVAKEKRITYSYVKQAFLKAYLGAWQKYAKGGETAEPQFLVIEEINRGNCAQIFGDLFQLLDRSDNGFSTYPIEADSDLQNEIKKAFAEGGEYAIENGLDVDDAMDGYTSNYGETLSDDIKNGRVLLLPNNFYIWATMNTSDQSLFPIDSAFKRRWDWRYVKITDAGKAWKIKCGTEYCDWWTFVEEINKKIAKETSSDDKKLGYFFCKAKDGVITADKFVSKVLFYLWNDVFKDGDISLFKVSDEPEAEICFDAFYDSDNKVNIEAIRTFLVSVVGEENIKTNDDAPIAVDEDENGNAIDYTKYSFDGKSRLSKKDLGYNIVMKYINEHSDKTFAELQSDLAFDDTVDNKYRYKGVLARAEEITGSYASCFGAEQKSSDGVKYKVLTWWNKYNIDFIIKFAKAQGWALPFIHIFDNSQHLTFAEEIVKSCFESCISWT